VFHRRPEFIDSLKDGIQAGLNVPSEGHTRYLTAHRAANSVELIENMPDMAGGTGRPTASRGWYYVARWGGGILDYNAFRILTNS
jgi:hypothetical protein